MLERTRVRPTLKQLQATMEAPSGLNMVTTRCLKLEKRMTRTRIPTLTGMRSRYMPRVENELWGLTTRTPSSGSQENSSVAAQAQTIGIELHRTKVVPTSLKRHRSSWRTYTRKLKEPCKSLACPLMSFRSSKSRNES